MFFFDKTEPLAPTFALEELEAHIFCGLFCSTSLVTPIEARVWALFCENLFCFSLKPSAGFESDFDSRVN